MLRSNFARKTADGPVTPVAGVVKHMVSDQKKDALPGAAREGQSTENTACMPGAEQFMPMKCRLTLWTLSARIHFAQIMKQSGQTQFYVGGRCGVAGVEAMVVDIMFMEAILLESPAGSEFRQPVFQNSSFPQPFKDRRRLLLLENPDEQLAL